MCGNNLSAPSCFCVCSFCFWGEVSNSWILNGIGRKSLLGNGKKIAKFLMRTFTYRSTFLYAWTNSDYFHFDLSEFWVEQDSLRFDLSKFWNKKGSLFFGIKICKDRSFFASFHFVPISLTFFNFHTRQNEIQDTA